MAAWAWNYSYSIVPQKSSAHPPAAAYPMAIGVQTDMAPRADAICSTRSARGISLRPAISGEWSAALGVSENRPVIDVASIFHHRSARTATTM